MNEWRNETIKLIASYDALKHSTPPGELAFLFASRAKMWQAASKHILQTMPDISVIDAKLMERVSDIFAELFSSVTK